MATLRYALVGTVGAGKTTLFNALRGREEIARKTQALEFDSCGAMDTPGEFISHPRLYRALITSTEAVDVLVYVHAANEAECRLPPGLLDIHAGKRLIGVISKCDLADADPDAAERLMRRHGIHGDILRIAHDDPTSIERLRQQLHGRVPLEEECQ
jgi:ethanolamine utilization protein, EutP